MRADSFGLAADLAAPPANPSGVGGMQGPVGNTPREELRPLVDSRLLGASMEPGHQAPGVRGAAVDEPLQPTVVHTGHEGSMQAPHGLHDDDGGVVGTSGGNYGLTSEFGAAEVPVGGYGLDAQIGHVQPLSPPPPPPLSPQSKPLTSVRGSGWRKARSAIDTFGFIRRVGAMAANARPSPLREMSLDPTHSYAAVLVPNVLEDGTGIEYCEPKTRTAARAAPVTPGHVAPTADVEDIHVPSVAMTFTKALDVPSAGLNRMTSHVLLRACLVVDGKLTGNVAVVPGRPTTDAQGVPTWRFGFGASETGSSQSGSTDASTAYHLLVRSFRKKNREQRGDAALDVFVHVELNVVPVATPEDEVIGGGLSNNVASDPAARRRAKQVDEVCVAWGRCPWPDEFSAGATNVDVQLVGAGMDAPMALTPSRLASTRAASVWRRHTKKGKLLGKGPTISIKIGMLKLGVQSALVNKLPREIVCPAAMVPVIATYREMASGEVAAVGPGLYVNTCNPTLRVLPSVLSDPHLAEELMDTWRRMTARWTTSQKKDSKRRQELLEGLTLKFWPLLHADAMPEVPVAGNVAASRHRAGVIKAYAGEHPVAALNRAPDDWLHRPFDVSELSHNFGDPVVVYA